jgi:hypothetical protein
MSSPTRAAPGDLIAPSGETTVGSEVQCVVRHVVARTVPARMLRDVGRYSRLVDRGWAIHRYTKLDVHRDPDRIVAELTRARHARLPSTGFRGP